MKEYLNDFISRKKCEIADLQKRSDESQDLAEVKAIGEKLKGLNDEIKAAEEQLEKLEETQPEERATVPAGVELRNATVVASFGGKNEMTEANFRHRL